jgi:hypothetical protein
MNAQTIRNMRQAGLPVAVSEGRYTGTLKLTSYGHVFDHFGGDGKVRRLAAIPFQVRSQKPRQQRSLNGRCITIRPLAS